MNERQIFFETLDELAARDPRIILIVGDVGFSYLDSFIEKHPEQYINAGVTEQSFMGIAAGLSLSNWKPYVYSMIPFVTMRNYEQLRNDVCHHNANVKVLGVRGSVHYRFLGFSHNVTPEDEDVRILSHLPNLKIYTPKVENVRQAILESYESPHPCYIRL